MPGADVELRSSSGVTFAAITESDGSFAISLPSWGTYTVHVRAAGFAPASSNLQLISSTTSVALKLQRVAGVAEQVVVSARASDIAMNSPDPSQKVMVREDLLDANPGRPGAPISIPGMPTETAAGVAPESESRRVTAVNQRPSPGARPFRLRERLRLIGIVEVSGPARNPLEYDPERTPADLWIDNELTPYSAACDSLEAADIPRK